MRMLVVLRPGEVQFQQSGMTCRVQYHQGNRGSRMKGNRRRSLLEAVGGNSLFVSFFSLSWGIGTLEDYVSSNFRKYFCIK